jgi:hypothetical protein
MIKHYYITFLVLLFYACVKDKPVAVNSAKVQLSSAKKVYVVNEGNFGSGNSSISLYDPGNAQVIENIYRSVNNSDIGDVAQSLSFINGKFYIVVNNSSKILVCDNQFKKIAQLNGLLSPRYIQPVSNQKAYVSDFKVKAIHVIDLNNHTKLKSIACDGWTEGMTMLYNKVLVTNPKKQYAYIINAVTDILQDSIFVGINAYGTVLDKNDKVWVLSGGDSDKSLLPRLSKLNITTNQVEAFYEFKSNDKPGTICLNQTKDSLYFLNRSIYRMAITDNALPNEPFINSGGRNYYGLGISPHDFKIYAADALDYSQKSNIYIFDATGKQLSFFKAGINANGFYFE